MAFGAARYADIRRLLNDQLAASETAAPELPDPPPFHADPPRELDLDSSDVVIFTSGFRPEHARWVRFPAFDAMGFPLTNDGASTVVPGLYFCGVHFMRKRKSSVLFGVGEDARHRGPHHRPQPIQPSRSRLKSRSGCRDLFGGQRRHDQIPVFADTGQALTRRVSEEVATRCC